MRKTGGAVAMALAGLALGVLLAVQARGVWQAGGLSLWGQGSLQQTLTALREEKAALQAELTQTQEKTATLRQEKADTEGTLASLNESMDTVRRQAGLTELAGRGLVVSINPRTYVVDGQKKIVRVISDQELLLLVNELNAAGAKGISINGQRLISRSAIRLAGNFINVNNIATSMPYEVRALGDGAGLETALRLYGGMFDQLSEFYDVTLTQTSSMTLPAYQGALLDGAAGQ